MQKRRSSPARTWARVTRLLEDHPELKKVRLDAKRHRVAVGFYQAPDAEALKRIEAAVRSELSGGWDVTIEPDGDLGFVHLHKIDGHTTEIHRAHPREEPEVIWKGIALPAWRNRPYPPVTTRNHRVMLTLAASCGLSTLAGFLVEHGGFGISFFAPFFAVAYLTGGWFATQDVWEGLRHRKIDIQFLMVAVALGALAIGAWVEGATLLFLFSLSNALEQFANYRTRKSIESLLQAAPKHALLRSDHAWIEVPVEEVGPDDELLVKPGEQFPVDGVVIEGASSADESALTGESVPIPKNAGDSVSGGTLNLDGQCVVRAVRGLEESALSQIIALIEVAQKQKAPAQRFTDTFSRYYTWFALSLGAVAFAVLCAQQRPIADAFYRAMTVLVVASPCALVLSIPSAILVAIAAGARRGILFRGGVAIENLGSATRFAFDKTGTLTKGTLKVAETAAFAGNSEGAVLQLAASVAQFSTHPLARAILAEAEKRRLSLLTAEDFLNVPGLGMEANVNGTRIFVGSRRLMSERAILLPEVATTTAAEVWVGSSEPIGVLYLRDEIRAESKGVITFLRNSRIPVTLLTGDRPGPAAMVAEQVGIEDVRAELSPAAKLQCIHGWRAAGERVAMVGDGINDAPSLTAADVSLGMGAHGSDAALEQADVILMHDKIENVEAAFRLSRRARSIIRQNVVISLGVILVLLVSALAEKINLTTGVIGHEGSTVVVILNGLRLLRFGTNRRESLVELEPPR